MRGSKFTGCLLAARNDAVQRGAAGYVNTHRQCAIGEIGQHAAQRHRWHWRQKIWVNHFQQMLGEARKLGVQF